MHWSVLSLVILLYPRPLHLRKHDPKAQTTDRLRARMEDELGRRRVLLVGLFLTDPDYSWRQWMFFRRSALSKAMVGKGLTTWRDWKRAFAKILKSV